MVIVLYMLGMIVNATNLSNELSARVCLLFNEGDEDQARLLATEALDAAKKGLNVKDEGSVMRLIESLETKGDFFRLVKSFEKSRLCYIEAIKHLRKFASRTRMLARLNASVGVLYDLVGNYSEARQFYDRSLVLYDRSKRRDDIEVADISNNLAFIYRFDEDYENAEKYFLKALMIYREELGDNAEKTATVFNNLGALYLYSNSDEKAYEMHRMALASRIEVCGEDHLDTAQSYSNLAVSEFRVGKEEPANENFLKGVSIFERKAASGVKVDDDYSIIIDNYVTCLRSLGREGQARRIIKRAEKSLSSSMNKDDLSFSFSG